MFGFFLYLNINKQLIREKKGEREREREKNEYSSFNNKKKKIFVGTNRIEFICFSRFV